MSSLNLHELSLSSERDCVVFAESAFNAQCFDLIVQRFGQPLIANTLILAWVGRAKFQLGEISEARQLLATAISESPNELPDWAKLTLQHCAWRDPLPFTERLPKRLEENVRTFGNFVNRLIQFNEIPPRHDDRFTTATLAIYWVKAGVQTFPRDGEERISAADLKELNSIARFY